MKPCFFLKIVENQFIESTIKGYYHFSSFKEFRKIENKFNDQVIGDNEEGKVHFYLDPKKFSIYDSRTRKNYGAPFKSVKLNLTVENNYGICSFICLGEDCWIELEKNIFILKQTVYRDLNRLLKEKEKFAQKPCSLLLFKSNSICKFAQKVFQTNIVFTPVRYESKPPLKTYSDLEVLRFKQPKYKYQHEWRMIKAKWSNKNSENVFLQDLVGNVTVEPTSLFTLPIKI